MSRSPVSPRHEALVMYALVGVGSAVGGVFRALVSLAGMALLGAAFPLGTLAANVAGSFLIGFYAALTGPGGRVFHGARLRQFVMAGFCGGFTTFSVFSLETLLLARQGKMAWAGFNVGLSVCLWLAAVWLGHAVATRFNRLRRS